MHIRSGQGAAWGACIIRVTNVHHMSHDAWQKYRWSGPPEHVHEQFFYLVSVTILLTPECIYLLQSALHHYASLNSLQYKRKTSLLEPLIGYMHAQKAFFDMGRETLATQDLDDFLSNINASVQGLVQPCKGFCSLWLLDWALGSFS